MTMIDQLIDFDYLLMRRMDASIKEQQEMREMHQLVQVLLAIFAGEESETDDVLECNAKNQHTGKFAECLQL